MSGWNRKRLFLFVLVVGLLLAACAPTVSPAPQPAAPQPAAAPTARPAAVPQVAPDDAAWQEVVKAAQKEGRLIIYDYGLFGGDWGRAVTAAFKNRYGISVDLLITGGSSVTLEKLRVEKKMGITVADMATAGSVSARAMIELGVMKKDVHRDLPALKDKSVFIMDPVYSPGGEAISINYTRLGQGFNTNLVKPGEIQSQYDLLDPKWRGKIAMRDPRLGSGGEPLSVTTFLQTKTLDENFFLRLAEQKPALLGVGYFEVAQMVARGEYAVYWAAGIDNYLSPLIKEGAPISVTPMKEGTIAQSSTLMILEASSHPNAAKLFVNWILTADGQRVLHEVRGAPPFRKDLPDFSPALIASLKFDKIIPFTWELADQVNTDVRGGLMEKLFGKR